MIVVIDNFDSFAYNLVQLLGALGAEVEVFRNNQVSPEHVDALGPKGVVISPGPCTPREAGISKAVIERLAGRLPILGVCLGHQCIAEVFGGRVVRSSVIMHGKTSWIHHAGTDVAGWLKSLPTPFQATRYHSLTVDPNSIPDSLEVTAWTEDGHVMGIRHRRWRVEGMQFHPESILSEGGANLLASFLVDCGEVDTVPTRQMLEETEKALKGVVAR